MVFLLVIILPGNTNICINIVHQAVHTKRKAVLEEPDTIEFIFKEDNCGKTLIQKEKMEWKRIFRMPFQSIQESQLGESSCVNIHSTYTAFFAKQV